MRQMIFNSRCTDLSGHMDMNRPGCEGDSKREAWESQPLVEQEEWRHTMSRRHFWKALLSFFIVLIWLVYSKLAWSDCEQITTSEHKDTAWEEIVPSEKLEWHSCFSSNGPFQCARLTVPMDYHRPLHASQNNPKVHIAMIMLPGNHSGSSETHSISPLLLNPGGPGGSGVRIATALGQQVQTLTGEDRDVIGFDPRGVGATTPRTDCYSFPKQGSEMPSHSQHFGYDEDDHARGYFHRVMFETAGRGVGLPNSTNDSLRQLHTRAETISKLCAEKDSIYGSDSIYKYVHTPSVAQDMLSIIDAWDEWIKDREEAEKRNGMVKYEAPKSTAAHVDPRLNTKGKLVYWGFSYGTLLGATFAAMFPDRVGRVVLDGVVDADFYVSPMWRECLQDTDKVLETFAEYCYKAKDICQLYRNNDQPEDIAARLQVIYLLKENPISVISSQTKAPSVIGYSEVKDMMFNALYSPVASFPKVANLIDLLYRKEAQKVGQLFAPPWDPEPFCSISAPAYMYPNDAQMAIMCSDKRYPLNQSLSEIESMYQKYADSSSFADHWMTIMIRCSGYTIKPVDPPMRWDDHLPSKPNVINTSFPLLFISNTLDPVTPLASALKMSRKFVGSGLIEQKSQGHCSLAAVSTCTLGRIRAYFQDGEVPPHPVLGEDLRTGEWLRCEADEWPWHEYHSSKIIESASTEELETMSRMAAAKEVQDVLRRQSFFGQDITLPDANTM